MMMMMMIMMMMMMMMIITHWHVYPQWKKKHLFKNSRKTLEVQGSRNRNWDNMETKNNDCPSAA